MQKHSIIIPHRNYNGFLRHCLWSIRRSAEICKRTDYEILVVDQGSLEPPVADGDDVTVISQPHSEPSGDGRCYFNKPRAQNEGIRQSTGEVFSFLDADAIVGPRWMECVDRLKRLGAKTLTKLCYRVRYLPKYALSELDLRATEGHVPDRAEQVDAWLGRWKTFQRAREHYGEVDRDPHDSPAGRGWEGDEPYEEPVFGNSQFSISRLELGETRFDEAYLGRGFEDLAMNRAIYQAKGSDYRAGIVTDPQHAMFHIRNPNLGELWGAGRQNRANFQRFYSSGG